MGSMVKNIVDYYCLSPAQISYKFRPKQYEDESKKKKRMEKITLIKKIRDFYTSPFFGY